MESNGTEFSGTREHMKAGGKICGDCKKFGDKGKVSPVFPEMGKCDGLFTAHPDSAACTRFQTTPFFKRLFRRKP